MPIQLSEIKDYPSLQQLARSLWKSETTGRAALFVGAGVSRNARLATPSSPKPPLWFELANHLASQLGLTDKHISDQLRLAEEYRAYFGRVALESELRLMISDNLWFPAEIHKDLLSLPWSDVLTTNYDSLLERAAEQDVGRIYSIVRSEADLVHSPSPRIVKLHGTVGIDKELILTEEDYRKYPDSRAAFVNLARQIFIENDLCLVGFSGTDPNFLQWSGWVRDRLSGSHRRIFLVGILNISESSRRLLEERNISPIDLAPLFGPEAPADEQHHQALQSLFSFLKDQRPREIQKWSISSDQPFDQKIQPSEASQRDHAKKIIQSWRRERENYPGWVVCPPSLRTELRLKSDASEGNLRSIWRDLPPETQEEGVIELLWRYETSFWPLGQFLIKCCREIIQTQDRKISQRLASRAFPSLLRAAREKNDWDDWHETERHYLAHINASTRAPETEIIFEQCLKYRDQLDYAPLEKSIQNLAGDDPFWYVRQAALWLEVGETKRAISSLTTSLNELRRMERLQPNSIWVRSRRAWAAWLLFHLGRTAGEQIIDPRQYADWAANDGNLECDPWSQINHARNEVSAELEKFEDERAAEFIAGFQPGTYSDHSNRTWFVSHTVISSSQNVRRLSDEAGLPLRTPRVAFLAAASDAFFLAKIESSRWYLDLFRAGVKENHRLARHALSRFGLAIASKEHIHDTFDKILTNLDFAISKAAAISTTSELRPWIKDRAERALNWLARLVIRLSPEDATRLVSSVSASLKTFLRDDVSFGKALNLCFESCNHIFGPKAPESVVLLALEMPPLLSSVHTRTIDLIASLNLSEVTRTPNEIRWNNAINSLISDTMSDDRSRTRAILRLTSLFDNRLLTKEECSRFAAALWTKMDEDISHPLPAATNIYPFVLARLPAPEGICAKETVTQRIWENLDELPNNSGELLGLTASLHNDKLVITPSAAKAVDMFDQALRRLELEREPSVASDTPQLFPVFNDKPSAEEYGTLLNLLAPLMDHAALSLERGTRTLNQITTSEFSSGLGAAVHFAERNESLAPSLCDAIIRAIAHPRWQSKANATQAISKWLHSDAPHLQPYKTKIVDALVQTLHSGTEPGVVDILRSTNEMIRSDRFSKQQLADISRGLVSTLPFSKYDAHRAESRISNSLSLVRAAMVEILIHLKGDWPADSQTAISEFIESCHTDPLPEVRHAAAAAAAAASEAAARR